jgi:isopenicillin N synthase-like dioxygenase
MPSDAGDGAAAPRRVAPVDIPYAELLAAADAALAPRLAAALGPDGLGLLTVSGVPGFAAARAALLPLARRVAALPPAARAACEDAAASYNVGWSAGREKTAAGRPDRRKGSFYANPLFDAPTDDPALLAAFPGDARPNRWPRAALPELEPAFKALGALLAAVGGALAARCDAYVAAAGGAPPRAPLAAALARSRCFKGRLLHYFPPDAPAGEEEGAGGEHEQAEVRGGGGGEAPESESESESEAWCGWHTDHGSLTALTPAMYLDAATGAEAPTPDGRAGLWVRDRAGRAAQVAFPPGAAAFQVGAAAQVASGGLLRATPHCVRAPKRGAGAGVCRAAFAVFMQPGWGESLAPPAGVAAEVVGVELWREGDTFGDFAARTLDGAYN